jgi:hypothetical protein
MKKGISTEQFDMNGKEIFNGDKIIIHGRGPERKTNVDAIVVYHNFGFYAKYQIGKNNDTDCFEFLGVCPIKFLEKVEDYE